MKGDSEKKNPKLYATKNMEEKKTQQAFQFQTESLSFFNNEPLRSSTL